MGVCGVRLSGIARCTQPQSRPNRSCSYHEKLEAGLVALEGRTLRAIRHGTEGDLGRTPAYAKALRRARADVDEAKAAAARRDHRRTLETVLLLACAGDLRAWPAEGVRPQGGASVSAPAEQRKRKRREPIRVWRSV